ncbi:MAG: TIGR03936 family radical SAM-associated protein [Microthrixaceae bacterium]
MRARIRYTVTGRIRFLGHRDVARTWERALRRAGMPVAYSEGFSPRPKLHFGLALSVGHESLAEYVDVDFAGPVDVAGLPSELTPHLPVGIEAVGAVAVQRADGSLQATVDACTWSLWCTGVTTDELAARAAELLAATELPATVTRKGKQVPWDLRPIIKALDVAPDITTNDRGGSLLTAELATAPRGIRIPELLAAFEPLVFTARVTRLNQWTTTDGSRTEPVPMPRRVSHALERAS